MARRWIRAKNFITGRPKNLRTTFSDFRGSRGLGKLIFATAELPGTQNNCKTYVFMSPDGQETNESQKLHNRMSQSSHGNIYWFWWPPTDAKNESSRPQIYQRLRITADYTQLCRWMTRKWIRPKKFITGCPKTLRTTFSDFGGIRGFWKRIIATIELPDTLNNRKTYLIVSPDDQELNQGQKLHNRPFQKSQDHF